MTPRSFLLTPQLADYVRAGSEPPDEVAVDLLAETAAMAERGEVPPTFQIAPEQGAFMQLLTRALGVRRAIEIGTFTGFSALCIARGLADGGRLLCLGPSEEGTAIARRHLEAGGGAGPGAGGGPRSPAATGSGPASPTGSSCAAARRWTCCGRCRPSRCS